MVKKVIRMVCLAMSLALTYSCAQTEEREPGVPYPFTKAELDTISRYIQVENDLYVFKLSKNEAFAKGISSESYESLQEGISTLNQVLENARAEGLMVSMGVVDNN